MAYDPTIAIWPNNLRPKFMSRGRIHPVNFGGETLVGPGQSVTADAGRWKFGHRQTALFGDRVLTMRAMVTRLAQRKPIYVTPMDELRTPRKRASVALPPGVPFSDGSIFSDGSTFHGQPVDFLVAASAAARAVTINVQRVGPSEIALTAGNYIGLDDRLHSIEAIFPSSDGVAGKFTLTIWPYLRRAAAANDPVYTEAPIVRCLAARDTLEVPEVLDRLDRFGTIDLDFEEDRW
jgi:hypothetical protein